EADMLPWMCGRQTLTIVVSSPCMTQAQMIVAVVNPRCAAAGALSPLIVPIYTGKDCLLGGKAQRIPPSTLTVAASSPASRRKPGPTNRPTERLRNGSRLAPGRRFGEYQTGRELAFS